MFKNHFADNPDDMKCAFCRQVSPDNNIKETRKLMKNNKSEAFILMAGRYKVGQEVFQSDTRSLEMYIRAAELGKANAFALIAQYYEEGIAVQQDMSNAIAFYELAAQKGCVKAHCLLALLHEKNGDIQLSIKHRRVAASAGEKSSMDYLMKMYKLELLSKEELTQTLRAHQTSSNELNSKERDDAREMVAAVTRTFGR